LRPGLSRDDLKTPKFNNKLLTFWDEIWYFIGGKEKFGSERRLRSRDKRRMSAWAPASLSPLVSISSTATLQEIL
jgi:hypothetical protein